MTLSHIPPVALVFTPALLWFVTLWDRPPEGGEDEKQTAESGGRAGSRMKEGWRWKSVAEVSEAAVQQEVRKDAAEHGKKNGVERAGRIINRIKRGEVMESSDLLLSMPRFFLLVGIAGVKGQAGISQPVCDVLSASRTVQAPQSYIEPNI